MKKRLGPALFVPLAIVGVALLPRVSAHALSAAQGALPCAQASSITFRPANHEQSGTCVQSGPGGFNGAFGMGIPIQFVRPAGMSEAMFKSLSGDLHALCAQADIVPADGVGLPAGMTEARFEQANRDGELGLSPCAKPHMRW